MRALTEDEQAVLADVLLDPDSWWAHACSDAFGGDAEEALAVKCARHRPAYEARVASEGGAYQNRSQREAK